MTEQKLEYYTKLAYETYSEQVSGKSFNGDPLPSWEEFSKNPSKQKQVKAWRALVEALFDKDSDLKHENFVNLMKRLHDNQTRKDGTTPYWTHPLRVSQNPILTTNDQVLAALFHDVVEDTSTTLTDLFNLGVPLSVVSIVEVLTKRKGETYLSYLSRVRLNKDAVIIKIADILDNMLDNPSKDYRTSLKILLQNTKAKDMSLEKLLWLVGCSCSVESKNRNTEWWLNIAIDGNTVCQLDNYDKNDPIDIINNMIHFLRTGEILENTKTSFSFWITKDYGLQSKFAKALGEIADFYRNNK